MKRYSIRLIGLLAIFAAFGACKGDIRDIIGDRIETSLGLSYVHVPSLYNIGRQDEIEITGKGFRADDVISFTPRAGQGETIDFGIDRLADAAILLAYSGQLEDGRYDVHAKRGPLTELIGKTNVQHVFRSDIPDRENMTVKGTVHANGQGIAGVVVSDGVVLAETDENGVYYLPSEKKNGHVFISVPGNYEVPVKDGVPQFFKPLAITSATEVKDFELLPVNNENHVVLAMADLHLANRNQDLAQFENGFLADANQLIADYQSQGKKVYGLTLGDLTWETYWYSNNFMLPEYVKQMVKLEIPVFNVIGNHDHDPYFADDWLSENAYRRTLGPTYYSLVLLTICSFVFLRSNSLL